jgi:hypothetical protein
MFRYRLQWAEGRTVRACSPPSSGRIAWSARRTRDRPLGCGSRTYWSAVCV